MRYRLLTDFGGFLWWLLIKLGKTSLEVEQTKEKWARNLFFLIVLLLSITIISINLF